MSSSSSGPMLRLDAAVRLAAEAHAGQFRDGDASLPYITHPVEVLIALRQVGGVVDEDLLCAAALHDVLEETDVSAAEIREEFGGRVADLVDELTRREPTEAETAGMEKDAIWRMRAEMLLAEIGEMSSIAQTVKLADRLANIRDAKRTKRGKKLDRYVWQTREILRIVPRDVNPGLWDAVAAEVADL